MAIAFRAISDNNNGGGDEFAVGNKPTGTLDNDILIAFIVASGSGDAVFSAPSGWVLVQTDPAPVDFSVWSYRKVAASEGASWTWTMVDVSNYRVIVVAISGGNTTSPINVSTAEITGPANTIALGAITTTVDGCLIVSMAAVDATGAARTWTADGTPDERLDSMALALHCGVYTETQASQGSITRSLTVSGTTQDMAGHIIAVAPAAGGGTEVTPGTASLTITAQTPTVAATANVGVTPGAASLAITAQTPTAVIDNILAPGTGSLAITAQTPTVATTANVGVAPGAGSLTITAQTPTVATTGNVGVTPGAGSLTITAQTPTVATTGNVGVTPGAGSLTITGQTPTVAATANVGVTPGTASLSLAAWIAEVTVSGEAVGSGAILLFGMGVVGAVLLILKVIGVI